MTLALHGASVLTLCEEELMNDPALRNTWANLFTDYDSSKVRLEEESLTTIKIELYCDIVKRFLHVANNQFRKDVLHEFGREKSERLRKKIVPNSKDLNPKLSMRIPDKGSAAESSDMPSTSQMSKKGKHVRKRRSKCLTTSGKPKKKSKAEEFTDEPDHRCPKCNKLYVEDETWIACDLCDRWFDPICAGLTYDQWADIDNFDWYCAECQVKTSEQILATTYLYISLFEAERDRVIHIHYFIF